MNHDVRGDEQAYTDKSWDAVRWTVVKFCTWTDGLNFDISWTYCNDPKFSDR